VVGERGTFILVDVVLLGLLAATYGVSFLHLGILNPILNLSIAVAKAGLVAWFFMHLRAASPAARLFAGAALFWLVILFALGLSDWLAR
jgi:cytochrome c oxidase subunit 4